MCIHPEAITITRIESPSDHISTDSWTNYQDRGLSKPAWMIRQTNYPSNKMEKFALNAETEQ